MQKLLTLFSAYLEHFGSFGVRVRSKKCFEVITFLLYVLLNCVVKTRDRPIHLEPILTDTDSYRF